MSDNQQVFIKFSVRLASKVHRIKQMLKPVMKLMNKKHRRCTAATPPPAPCAAPEPEENAANETLERRMREEMLARAGQGCAMRVWLEGRLCLVPVPQAAAVPVPVHFVSWAPLKPDSDLCHVDNVHTTGQTAEEQTPLVKYE